MDNVVGYFAVVPLWMRLVVLYLCAGLFLGLYRAQRDAGKTVAAAIGAVLLAAVVGPVQAAMTLFRGKATILLIVALALCVCSTSLATSTASQCSNGQCPVLRLMQQATPPPATPAEQPSPAAVTDQVTTVEATATVEVKPAQRVTTQRSQQRAIRRAKRHRSGGLVPGGSGL